MPYSSFTIDKVKKEFSLTVVTKSFFQEIKPVIPSQWLTDHLNQTVEFAATLGTEKARSEFIIAPLLFELRQSLYPDLALFSGTDFTVDSTVGLNGLCDFLITRSNSEVSIEAPVLVVIEAKKGELNAGWGQCAAEMIAAQRFNLAADKPIKNIYGSVTTGTQWQFLKLTGQKLNIDVNEYSLAPVSQILGILHWMIDNTDSDSIITSDRAPQSPANPSLASESVPSDHTESSVTP
jgi:hypothetical protein